MAEDTQVTVRDDPAAGRYEARIGEQVAGFAEYRRDGDRVVFTHTVVDDEFEGRGVGSALARTALDEARQSGLGVVPRCSFIRGWIEKHPDYRDLVTE